MSDSTERSGDRPTASRPIAVPVEAAAHDTWQSDVAALLRAVGLSDHARPVSPHLVVQDEILPAIDAMRARLAPGGTEG